MGRLIYDSLINNDFNIAMAVFLIFAFLVALFNLAADILYAFIDPEWSTHECIRFGFSDTAQAPKKADFLRFLATGD